MPNLAGSGATPASAGFEPPSSWGLAPRRTSGLPRLVRDPRNSSVGIVNLSGGGILTPSVAPRSVQRSPWHAYRPALSQERGAKKVDSTELS
jgi:hypothetical protein